MNKGDVVLYGVGVVVLFALCTVLYCFPNGIGGYHG